MRFMNAISSGGQNELFMSQTPSRVMTVPEVAAHLRCSKAHVHNLINGKVPGLLPLPSLSLGRRRLVRTASLQEWIARNERGVV